MMTTDNAAPARGGNPDPAAAGGQPGAQPAQGLTPEQIKQVDLMTRQCMQLLLEDGTAQMIVAKASQGDPAQALAGIVAPLLRQVYEAGTQAGAQVDTVATLVAGMQVFGLLAEMLVQADVLADDNQGAQVAVQAAKIAVEQHNAQFQGGAPTAPAGAQPGAAGPAGAGMMMAGG